MVSNPRIDLSPRPVRFSSTIGTKRVANQPDLISLLDGPLSPRGGRRSPKVDCKSGASCVRMFVDPRPVNLQKMSPLASSRNRTPSPIRDSPSTIKASQLPARPGELSPPLYEVGTYGEISMYREPCSMVGNDEKALSDLTISTLGDVTKRSILAKRTLRDQAPVQGIFMRKINFLVGSKKEQDTNSTARSHFTRSLTGRISNFLGNRASSGLPLSTSTDTYAFTFC